MRHGPSASRQIGGWVLLLIGLLSAGYGLFRADPQPEIFAHSNEIAHLGAFFVLVILAYLATARIGPPFVLILAGLLTLALGSEWIQGSSLLPRRHGTALDLLADLSGCTLGVISVALLESRRRLVRRRVVDRESNAPRAYQTGTGVSTDTTPRRLRAAANVSPLPSHRQGST